MDQNSSLVSKFDFNSQAGITAVLFSIRQSELNSDEKNELRDLVFSFTNGGGDESVRIALEQKLLAHNIKPVLLNNSPAPSAPVLSFGSLRPVPSFREPVVTFTPVETVSEPTPTITPTPIVVEQPAPVVVSTPTPTPTVAEAEVVIESPKVEKESVPPSVQPSIDTNYLDRIREIKSAVNSKVGNPVNLVDINNEVGREYMNALLEAMKRLSGGVVGELDSAMQRLELAYVAVEKAIADHQMASAPTPTPEPVAQIQSQFEVPVAVNNMPIDSIQAPISQIESPVISNNSNFNETVSMPISQPVVSMPESMVSNSGNSFGVTPIGYQANENTVLANQELRKIPSLADEKRNLTPQDLPERLSTSSDTISSPLYTGEIDSGLDQLLSDWSLFKKSGLFGSGPKGREHPLYLKISGLQIPLLLAGRFEGASQEIKQSITDYMNGWRYEQGIIYEQGETFEMYLRRVIKHILDLQKRRNPS